MAIYQPLADPGSRTAQPGLCRFALSADVGALLYGTSVWENWWRFDHAGFDVRWENHHGWSKDLFFIKENFPHREFGKNNFLNKQIKNESFRGKR